MKEGVENTTLTLDQSIRLLPEILERLTRIEALLDRPVTQNHQAKLLYDVHDLKALGIGEREAYIILRRYSGQKIKGRRQRITYDQLMDYYKRKDDI